MHDLQDFSYTTYQKSLYEIHIDCEGEELRRKYYIWVKEDNG